MTQVVWVAAPRQWVSSPRAWVPAPWVWVQAPDALVPASAALVPAPGAGLPAPGVRIPACLAALSSSSLLLSGRLFFCSAYLLMTGRRAGFGIMCTQSLIHHTILTIWGPPLGLWAFGTDCTQETQSLPSPSRKGVEGGGRNMFIGVDWMSVD